MSQQLGIECHAKSSGRDRRAVQARTMATRGRAGAIRSAVGASEFNRSAARCWTGAG